MDIIQLKITDKDLIKGFETIHAPDNPLYSRYDDTALNYIFNNPLACKAFGIFENKKFIGWGAYRSKEEGIFEISSIVIHHAHRRKGLGKRIRNYIIQVIEETHSFKTIYLTVYPHNKDALFLYLKNGFNIYDFRKDVYGPGADRVYLRYNES